MTRICMTLPLKILTEFDEVFKKQEYNSRSEGLKKAMQEFIKKHK